MSLSRTFADWIMRLATRRPPPARAEWALAMQNEYDALEHGRLSWAFGCLTARIGWTLRAQWLYILLLALPPFYLYWLSQLEFDLLWYGIVPRDAFVGFMRSYGNVLGLLEPLPLAILLGFCRPDWIKKTLVIGCLLAQHAGSTIYASYMLGGSFLSWWTDGATLYMAPPLIALCASLWVWYLGASLGARWARRRVSRTAA